MGIFIIRSDKSDNYFLITSQNLNAYINRTRFQLNVGSHTDKELQKEWNDIGAENFTIEILEKLDYDKDESKVDYTEELEVLKFVWEEKLKK